MGRGGRLGLLLATWVLLVTAAFAGSATGHTVLVGSTPADGDVVPMSSARLTLVFADELAPEVGQVAIVAPDGSGSLVGPLVIAGSTLEAGLGLSRPGRHRVDFRVTAADGHPLEGSLSFRVRPRLSSSEASSAAAPAAEAVTAAPATTSIVASVSSRTDPEAIEGGWWWAVATLLVLTAAIGVRRGAAVRSASRGA